VLRDRARGAQLGSLRRPAPPSKRTLAVALHDVEPATFERCVEIRTWLDERSVERVTLLVIPARDLHPVGERSPALVDWLATRRRLGDAIAQHGFQHEQLRRPSLPHRVSAPARARRAAEFAGLGDEETRRAVDAGWRLLKLAGIEPDGFVAPAYAYTPALRRAVSARFRWWASLLNLHGAATEPADGLSVPSTGRPVPTTGRLLPTRGRRLLPAWGPRSIRAGALLAGGTLRLDLSPANLERPQQLQELERTLNRVARRRLAVTYDELAGVPLQAENTEASRELRPRVAA
jgi:predicted deacetylase